MHNWLSRLTRALAAARFAFLRWCLDAVLKQLAKEPITAGQDQRRKWCEDEQWTLEQFDAAWENAYGKRPVATGEPFDLSRAGWQPTPPFVFTGVDLGSSDGSYTVGSATRAPERIVSLSHPDGTPRRVIGRSLESLAGDPIHEYSDAGWIAYATERAPLDAHLSRRDENDDTRNPAS